MTSHFSYHMTYKPSTNIIPQTFGPWANMGFSGWYDMWYKKCHMITYNYYLLFCCFCFVFCSLISFWLDHFQHTDSGNGYFDWLNHIKWTTIQIYNIKGALFDISIVWNMHRTRSYCHVLSWQIIISRFKQLHCFTNQYSTYLYRLALLSIFFL